MLPVALLAVAAVGSLWWTGRRQSGDLRPGSVRVAFTRASGQTRPNVDGSESARRIQDQAAYWHAHKARLRQLLAVDYPAALARRNARFPEVAAVVKFGKEYADNFERRNHEIFSRAEEQDKQHRARLREIEAQGRGGLSGDLLLAERWLANTEPVPGGATVGDLARQFWTDDPNGLIVLRRLVANAERRTFNDEAAAQRAESLQTSQEMADYILAARGRWEAEQTQVQTEAGYDAPVSEYLLGSQCAAMVNVLTENYQRESNKELDAIGKESDAILQAMQEPELAAASRDDPEARRLLTELQEMLLLRRAQKTGS